MHSADLGPVADTDQTQHPFDLFLIFAGANIVATTLQIGAVLPALAIGPALTVIAAGALGGALFVAVLAPVGSRLRVPSIVAARAALGHDGAQIVALVLFLTNFVWIALNNVIAASITSRLAGSQAHEAAWAVGLGLIAMFIVLGGPRAVGHADRVAVPALSIAGVMFTIACVRAPWPGVAAPSRAPADLLRAFDVVFGYQTSWLLMFGDYSRYSRSGKAAAAAVFGGLGLTALWFIPLGLVASTIARSSDPGAMVYELGLGWWGGALLVFATLTTNFVNIYMSALALKSLRPSTPDRAAIWIVGGVGAAVSVLSSTWLDEMASFTLVLAGIFVPVGAILVAHFFIRRIPTDARSLYPDAPGASHVGAWSTAGMWAWTLGAAVFYVARPIGGVVPSFLASAGSYAALARRGMTAPPD